MAEYVSPTFEYDLHTALNCYRPKARGIAVSIIEARPLPCGWGEWMASALRRVYPFELRALVRIELLQLLGDIPQLQL